MGGHTELTVRLSRVAGVQSRAGGTAGKQQHAAQGTLDLQDSDCTSGLAALGLTECVQSAF